MMMFDFVTAERVTRFLGVVLGVSIAVILAIMLDLWDGVHTARVTGQRVHSHKLRVTVAKISEYWRFVLIGFLVDCLGSLFAFYALPFLTVLFGLGLIVVEVRSMFEHAAKRNSHTAALPDILGRIVRCADTRDAQKIVSQLTGGGADTSTHGGAAMIADTRTKEQKEVQP